MFSCPPNNLLYSFQKWLLVTNIPFFLEQYETVILNFNSKLQNLRSRDFYFLVLLLISPQCDTTTNEMLILICYD